MEDFLTEFISEFIGSAMREGGRLTANGIFNAVADQSSSVTNTQQSLTRIGIMYYMNDGTLLYFKNDGREVAEGYNIHTWGDRWVDTDVPFYSSPTNFNGGIAKVVDYYVDEYGNLYS